MALRARRSRKKQNKSAAAQTIKQKASQSSPSNTSNIANYAMYLQRTVGNKATIDILQREQDEESPIKTKKRHLDQIENVDLPGLKQAAKAGDVPKFTAHMSHLLMHPLLLYSGTTSQFAKILGVGMVRGKFAVLGIYTRYVAAGKELAAICKKYDSDPQFYELIREYRERKAKAKAMAKDLKGVKGWKKKNKKRAARSYVSNAKIDGTKGIRQRVY